MPQWGIKETQATIESEITAINAVLDNFETDTGLVDAVMDKIDGWETQVKDKLISKTSMLEAARQGELRQILMEDIRVSVQV